MYNYIRKNYNMKYILNKCALLLVLPLMMISNRAMANEADTVKVEDTYVDVAHKKVLKSDILNAVDVVDLEELGKVSYSLGSMDNTNALVGGWNGNALWGNDDVLYLVDGIPRKNYTVVPSEISTISFLKGASSVILYGASASKGAVLITTKRGKDTPISVSATVNTGMHFMKGIPDYLGSAEYMTYYNQALDNDNLGRLYSDEDIYNYGSGSNPYRYPSVNFYSPEYVNNYFNRTDATVEVRGGTKRTRYYSNVGYAREGSYLHFGEANKNGSNRLNVRGNVDMDISRIVTAYANASVSLYDSRTANGDYWAAARSLRPNRVAPLIPLSMVDKGAIDAMNSIGATSNIVDNAYFLGGTQVDMTNIFAEYFAGGYATSVSRTFQFDTGIKLDLSDVVKGLTLDTNFAIDYTAGYKMSYDNNYVVFEPVWSNMNGYDSIISVNKYGKDERSGVQNVSDTWMDRLLSATVKLDYKRSFDDHNVSAFVLGTADQTVTTGTYHKPSTAHLGFQASYNYKHRYYFDFVAALSHSAKFAEGNRAGFSPSVSLGWNIANEDFLKGSTAVNALSLSVSASRLKSDRSIGSYYNHQELYSYGSYASFGWYDGQGVNAVLPLRGANPYLTYIDRDELEVTLKGSFFKNSLAFNVSAFYTKFNGGIISSGTMYPSYFETYWPKSSLLPYINYNEDLRKGVDFNVNYTARFTDGFFKIGVVGTYLDSEAIKRDENYEDLYRNRAGKPLDTMWGLQSDGLFATQEEIDAAPEQAFGTVKPGDIKYIDQNNDNIIDAKDEVMLGQWGNPLHVGLNLTAEYKGFSLFVAATSSVGGMAMKNTGADWIFGERKYTSVVRDAWTPETAETATYPRLSTQNSPNNFRNSDFWTYKTDRINLEKVQLSYRLSDNVLKGKLLKGMSFYVGGYNLLTISPEKDRFETNFWGAPYSRFVNIGVKATF